MDKSTQKLIKKLYKENKNNYIDVTELMKLTNIGILPNDLTWARTKMNNEHLICVRHTMRKKLYHPHQNKNEPNGHLTNGRAKFFLNDDELTMSSSYESRKDYQLSYDKYSNGRNSLSSDRSDDSTSKCSAPKLKKNSFNSKLKLCNEKANFFLGNNLSVYKSDNNLDNKSLVVSSGSNGRKLMSKMTKSNSFNNLINNYRNTTYKFNHNENYYSINSQTVGQFNNLDIPRQPRLITQCTSSILYLINPHDARISVYETDYVKIAQLNPIRPFVAVATNHTVHTISLRTLKVIATAHMDENVDYITWLSPMILAIVTSRTIFHWDLETTTTQPAIVFFKSPKMYNCQVTSYEADDTMSWFALSSLYLEEDKKTITGLVQIHHMNEQTKMNHCNGHELDIDANNNNCFQQCIEAHSVKFVKMRFDENNIESTTLIAVKKTSSNTIKIYIIELGPLKVQNNCLVSRTEILRFSDNINGLSDLPLHTVICFKLNLIYIVSKFGRLIICDLQTGIQLNEQQVVCEDVILSAKLDNSDHQSVILVARNGQVLLVELDFENLIKQFANDAKLKRIARRISHALNNVNEEVTRL